MTVDNVYQLGSLINLVIIILVFVGGYAALRSGVIRTTSEMQRNAIDALKEEVISLRGKIDGIEQENKKLEQIISTLCEAMKRRGLIITIDGNSVNVQDGNITSSTRITEV